MIMNSLKQSGFLFSNFKVKSQTPFEKLFEIFKELITYTSGDFNEAIDWLKELDKEYVLTSEDYTMDDFIEELLAKGYIKKDLNQDGVGDGIGLTAKTEMLLRQHALKQIFGKMKRIGNGNHNTKHTGTGQSDSGDLKNYEFGDSIEKIAITESIKNAQIQGGLDDFKLSKDDLVVNDQYHQAQMSTVLMIDISHSMILYGEDRITPAKKVAMALSEFITTRYPKDKLDIIVFGNDARPISIKELPYLNVGPFHTNTVAGLELAMDILRRNRNSNKQIFMITDGKPSCLKLKDGSYYKNSNGLDSHIVDKCYNMAQQARRLNIPITTFMIAQDPYLKSFVQEFTKANKGKAFYTGLKGLGEMIFEDYETNRKKRL
jgi:Ca-activated chloride channel family protein